LKPPTLQQLLGRKRRKYGNNPRGDYDSELEATRHAELIAMERAGLIEGVKHHPRYILLPNQRGTTGRVIERVVTYEPDFEYTIVGDRTFVVEDCKSPFTKTESYVIKRKLMLYVHGIRVVEVARKKGLAFTDALRIK
jgi:hypothetical protein